MVGLCRPGVAAALRIVASLSAIGLLLANIAPAEHHELEVITFCRVRIRFWCCCKRLVLLQVGCCCRFVLLIPRGIGKGCCYCINGYNRHGCRRGCRHGCRHWCRHSKRLVLLHVMLLLLLLLLLLLNQLHVLLLLVLQLLLGELPSSLRSRNCIRHEHILR